MAFRPDNRSEQAAGPTGQPVRPGRGWTAQGGTPVPGRSFGGLTAVRDAQTAQMIEGPFAHTLGSEPR